MSQPVRRRPPTMHDVASAAGVSYQTVSRVLNDLPGVRVQTAERVSRAIADLGYRRNEAARRLASTRSGTIGVLTWSAHQVGPASVLQALNEAVRTTPYRLSLVLIQELSTAGVSAAFEQLLEQQVEAIVVVLSHGTALRIADELENDVPTVVVEGDLSGRPLTAAIDNVLGARLATRHLLGLGHMQVVHLAGPSGWSEAEARIEGWRAESREHGLTPPPVRWRGDWTSESGYAAGLEIAERDDVRAVFAANDQMALGLVAALDARGRRVPDDVSVVGFDDLPESAYFAPPLTTVRQDFETLGARVVHLLEQTLAGDPRPVTDLVAPELMVRSSTAPPR